jgi:HK97 family phage prohead protease
MNRKGAMMEARKLDRTKREDLTFEIREMVAADTDGAIRVSGYASVFDKPSENLGGFVERIKPGAFTETLKEKRSDPRLLWDHNSQYVLGRRSAGTLSLTEDAKGLAFEATLPDTSYARDLKVLMERGDVREMSFGFNVLRDEWSDMDKPIVKRDVLEVRLIEISIVSFPAYPQTSVKLRDFEGAETLSDDDIVKVEEFIRTLSAPAAKAEPIVEPAAKAVDDVEWKRACMDADCLMAGIPLK